MLESQMNRSKAIVGAAVVAMLGLGAIAPAAQGAVIATVTNLGTPRNAAGTVSYPGLTAYRLTVSTNDGGLVSAVDFSNGTGFGGGLFSTSFSQRATLDPDDSSVRTLSPQAAQQNGTTSPLTFDTHFLPDASIRADAIAPSENNNGTNLAGGPPDTATGDFGTGTSLTAAFGILGAFQTQSFDLAYIVMPSNATATFRGQASENGVSSNLIGTIGPAVNVPEPTSLAAIGLGALGLIRRKRMA